MARGRWITPDFFDDEKVSRLSWGAKVLFIRIWQLADDAGHARGALSYLHSNFAAMNSPSETQGFLDELLRERLVMRYEVDSQQYLWVRNFKKHQQIKKPSKWRLPVHPEGLENQFPTSTPTSGELVPPPVGNQWPAQGEAGSGRREAGSGGRVAPAANAPPPPDPVPVGTPPQLPAQLEAAGLVVPSPKSPHAEVMADLRKKLHDLEAAKTPEQRAEEEAWRQLPEWEVPWTGGGCFIRAANKPNDVALQWEWMNYRRHETEHGFDVVEKVNWGHVGKELKSGNKTHTQEILRKAWLVWLAFPKAKAMDPPCPTNAFLSASFMSQCVSIAKRIEWVPLPWGDDWEIPDLEPKEFGESYGGDAR